MRWRRVRRVLNSIELRLNGRSMILTAVLMLRLLDWSTVLALMSKGRIGQLMQAGERFGGERGSVAFLRSDPVHAVAGDRLSLDQRRQLLLMLIQLWGWSPLGLVVVVAERRRVSGNVGRGRLEGLGNPI